MASQPNLVEIVGRELNGVDSAQLRRFVERLFAHDAGIEELTPSTRAAVARQCYEFFAVRDQPSKIRVTPAPGGDGIVVETLTSDAPFIVDSLIECFRSLGARVRSILHPIYRVARTADGHIASLERNSATEATESLVRADLDPPAAFSLEDIEGQVRETLAEVELATRDFETMTARALQICEETAPHRELIDVRDFLRWLVQGGFVFLGYRRYVTTGTGADARLTAETDADLGIMRERDHSRFRNSVELNETSAQRRKLFFEGAPLVITKVAVESHVHRRRPMDSVLVRRHAANGRALEFDNFVGLFTSKAYAEEAEHIPILRSKLRALLDAEKAAPGSHDYKELVETFNSFPKDELFRASGVELQQELRLIVDFREEHPARLAVLPDLHRGQVVALVVLRRDSFSTRMRIRLQQVLAEGLNGTLIYFFVALGEGESARLHFCFAAATAPTAAKVRELQGEVATLTRRWEDRTFEELAKRSPAHARSLAARWRSAFNDEYKAATSASRAAEDIERIEALLKGGDSFHVELRAYEGAGALASEIRMLGLGQAPMLSELMPTLQNFGVKVLAEDAHQLVPEIDGVVAHVEAFSVQGPDGQPLRDSPGAAVLADAITAVRSGIAEDDPLNALVVTANLTWREVALIRAYLAAAFQMRLAPARPALRRVLLGEPRLARALLDLFTARLDPRSQSTSERLAELRAAYLAQLNSIDNIADDRIARILLAMVEATVRTNYFREMPKPDPYLVLKFESRRIAGLADVAPLYEIHVNSPRMEGCHLRAGKVARGGIRFSDRPDDFRSEILDLMKTQTVKNAIIVPIGSKGGFVVKRRAPDAAGPETGLDAYRTLINAMFDVTDNVVETTIAHPPKVKVLDSDGPYLVVAADKGTASFSDVANQIARERGFWLDDAFASGGEHGFDHKKIGITARGAWESAKHHLRELGRDPEYGPPITMVGIGDMSGDVFGNGLLRSRNVKLIAAFDHRHIFIDPNPDPAGSFDERQRLYDQPHSQWSDYNAALISKGGGVWRRGEKRIELSTEARAALGCDADALDGESLIRAILRAPVDMLYNGGIGTYVRAGSESDAEVGDHANDACRIIATELRAKIVVEGGNLGFTQKARIEYALGGGRINTDAIDNSAGVDTSDHEVNLKILLAPEVKRGALSLRERNQLLPEQTATVADAVLADNRDQALALSLEQIRSRTALFTFRDHLLAIEQRGVLHREEAALPTREVLSARHARYPGLTRPELALINAFTKLDLTARLEESALPDDPALVARFLAPYFPAAIAERFAAALPAHRLRRELISTRMVNQLVDLMGSTFIFTVARDYLVEAEHATRCWLVASEVLGLHPRAEWLKSPARGFGAQAEIEAMFALERAGRAGTEWALREVVPGAALGPTVERFQAPFKRLAETFETLLVAGERERFEQLYRDLRTAIGEGDVAHELARLAFAGHLLTILSLSFERTVEIDRVAQAYFALSNRFDFSRLEGALAAIGPQDRWERSAARELANELSAARCALCRTSLDRGAGTSSEAGPGATPREGAQRLAEAEQLMHELQAVNAPSLAVLQVCVRALSRLAG